MSEFTKPIDLRFDNYGRPTTCQPIEGWKYYLDWEKGDEYVLVSPELVTDGVSTPVRLQGVLPKFDYRSLKAGISHDQLYKHPVIHLTDVEGVTRPCSKTEADKLFYKMLKLGGQKWVDATDNRWIHLYRKHSWQARAMAAYMALFLFGWVAFYKHRFNDWRKARNK